MRILFVCTGNTCRSPMAAALLQEKLRELGKERDIEVRSAGIKVFKGTSVARNTLTVLSEYGTKYDQKPKEISLTLIEWADLVLTMTKYHKWITIAIFPETIHKIFTFKEFVGEQNDIDISDPVGGSLTRYRQCAQEIERAVNRLQQQLACVPFEKIRGSFPFPTPQELPHLFSLLSWLVRLSGISQNARKK